MNCSTKAALSACSWLIFAASLGYFVRFKCCHWLQGLHSMDPWMEHTSKASTWAMSCSMLWGSSKLISSLVLAQPDNSQTTFMSNFAEVGVLGASKIRTKHPYQCDCVFPCHVSEPSFQERQCRRGGQSFPPWWKDPWNIDCASSCGKLAAASQAITSYNT